MSKVIAVIGAQWGDEGKGKIVDLLAERFEIVVRYQGGHNAGHSVQVGDQSFVLHLLPSGIVHRGKTSGRTDDSDEVVQRKRQEVYKSETLPVAAYYGKSKKVVNVHGLGEIDDVFLRLTAHIDKRVKI